MSRQSGLVAALIDDAAVFPPGNASMADAVQAHYAYRDSPYELLVGPLLVPASGIESLRDVVDPSGQLRLGLIGDTGLQGLIAARDAVQDDAWLEVTQLELRLSSSSNAGEAMRQLLDALAFTAPCYIELGHSANFDAALSVLSEDGVEQAKFRCGPEKVPTNQQLAQFISVSVRHSVPFKLTAGLHHALPFREPDSGITQHGFLNTLAATWTAISGEDSHALERILASDDEKVILEILATADPLQLRRFYRSFGSCSITEPYNEMVTLGLIEEEE